MTDGRLLAEGVTLIVAGISCLILTIMQYQGKGPVLSSAYFAADIEQREKMKTKKAYRYAANVLLYPTMSCLLFGISFILNNSLFSYVGTTIILAGILSGILFAFVTSK